MLAEDKALFTQWTKGN